MPKTNVTYVLCNIGGISQYVWIADAIDKNLIQLSFIFLDKTTDTLKSILSEKGFSCHQLSVNTKKDIPKAIYQAVRIFKTEKTDVVHTHLVDASLVGLSAASIAGVRKRIHTRHHADFHHQHYKKGVMLDNLINYLSTEIIVISKNVQTIVEKKERFHQGKLRLIHHGFRLKDFDAVSAENITRIKSTYGISGHPVIGMVSRYETGKGILYGILAFEKIIREYPDAKLVIANAFGPDKDAVKSQLSRLPSGSVIEITYEKDVTALYKSFDILVHVPVDATYEAFGQVYIEAMAAAVPVVCTLSGIAGEYITDGRNAVVADYKNEEQIYEGIKKLLNDASFKENIVGQAKKDVSDIFDFSKIMSELNKLYLSV